MEAVLVQMLLDGDLKGRIDQQQGLLDLSENTSTYTQRYAAVNALSDRLVSLCDALPQPQGPRNRDDY